MLELTEDMGVALGDDRAWLRKTVAIDEQTRERDQYPKKPVVGEKKKKGQFLRECSTVSVGNVIFQWNIRRRLQVRLE